ESFGNGTQVAATYLFAPPGGSWDAFDAGRYSLTLQSGQVMDNDGNAAAASTLGTFVADLPRSFVVTSTADSGPGSLRQAIIDANVTKGSDTITFDPVAFATPETINLTSGQLSVTEAIVLIGPGPARLTVYGSNNGRVICCENNPSSPYFN